MIGILSGRGVDSPFRRLDPRVRLFWMLVMSILAMLWARPGPLLVLMLTLLPVWIISKLTKRMFVSSVRLVPYLFFLVLLQIVPKFIFGGQSEVYLFRIWEFDLSMTELMKGAVETLRFFIMLQSAQVWLQTMDFGEMTAGIRQIIPKRRGVLMESIDKFMAVIAFLLGIAYQSVPIFAAEMQTIIEVQRARGVDITRGNRLQQVRKLVRMAVPLFIRSLELTKSTGLALLNYAFQVQGRSIYRALQMQAFDYVAMGGIVCLLTIGTVVKMSRPWL